MREDQNHTKFHVPFLGFYFQSEKQEEEKKSNSWGYSGTLNVLYGLELYSSTQCPLKPESKPFSIGSF